MIKTTDRSAHSTGSGQVLCHRRLSLQAGHSFGKLKTSFYTQRFTIAGEGALRSTSLEDRNNSAYAEIACAALSYFVIDSLNKNGLYSGQRRTA